MKVAKIQIRNILGLENLEILPGKVTIISGRNGSCKTSCLEAIKAALKGGHQAELLRKGAEVGEVVLVLDDGMRIVKTVEATESSIKLTHPEHGKVSKPMAFIGQLSDEISLNPIKFLECKPAERADFLLGAMPMEAKQDEIRAIVADAVNGNKLDVPAGHALKSVDAVYDQIFLWRQDINRAAKEKSATVEQLTASLPEKAQPVEAIKAEIAGMEKEWTERRDAVAMKQRDIDMKLLELEHAAEKYEAEQTAEIEKEFTDALAKITDRKKTRMAETVKTVAFMKENARKDHAGQVISDPVIAELGQKIAVAREASDVAVRNQNTLDVVGKMSEERDNLIRKSYACTAALEGLKGYKEKLLQDLPIKGIEIKNGLVYRGGVEFTSLNTAQQVQIAVDLAVLRAKELKMICVDGMECLDSERFAALEAAIGKTDLQLIATSVSDTELSVVTK